MTSIRENFEKHHTHNGIVDHDQLNIIFNPSRRLIVEAPAGYGKTKTMVSKIAYMIASNQLPNMKKILALTFSVNASLKIKREIIDQVRILFNDEAALKLINQKVLASNYHGFCRRILTLYGYLVHSNLTRINQLKVIDETNEFDLRDIALEQKEKDFFRWFAGSIKEFGKIAEKNQQIAKSIDANTDAYLNLVKGKLLPNDCLTYNSILLFAQYLLNNYPQIAAFYKDYFPIIFVDEFQDTNWLQWKLLLTLTGGKEMPSSTRHLYLFGDRMQRIYGFIGAIPKVFDGAQKIYQMDLIRLNTNHRFDNNSKLGKIDRILRANAENIRQPTIPFTVELPIIEKNSQRDVGRSVLDLINSMVEKDHQSAISILVRTGLTNATTREIYEALRTENVNFFYALYKEDDQEYIDFHKKCFDILLYGIKNEGFRSIKSVKKYMNKAITELPSSEVNLSLTTLLFLLLEKMRTDYTFLSFEEKASLILDTLASRGLKQHLDLVKEVKIFLATIHGAKGLEWDYVILPDLQKYCFPPARFCINICRNCDIDWTSSPASFEQSFLEELSVFYVAVTRARKDLLLLFSNSTTFMNGRTSQSPLSCLAQLPGIQRVEYRN